MISKIFVLINKHLTDFQIGCHLGWLLVRRVILAPTPDMNGQLQQFLMISSMYVLCHDSIICLLCDMNINLEILIKRMP